MAIIRWAWEAVSVFLGMDQFGSPDVASREIVSLLEQDRRQEGKVADSNWLVGLSDYEDYHHAYLHDRAVPGGCLLTQAHSFILEVSDSCRV